ncbi:heptaprenyl diphosphate synthase component 1 [Jeotgalibacillus sp. ET6]|uniref:heptaprenyl diphosphate synthase component 1 n=1 Tax=Jeotgalibacillus sp. ET6 TaxID=3037260 RepID=UPI0024187340|nr:heptaprenyl diphosphate synthase component 1 [Jeotgalibacillus sp. ET6]MDG5470650.1 heptaprenyl diphosphate synthase component 1 [Jeotgalibacillus sp. ET6]
MNTQINSRWMEETLQYINKQLHHSYLHNAIGAPEIDEKRLSLLLLPFQLTGSYSELDKSYVSTAMLIQTALDTHEKVSINESDSLKQRQLTVLAGDFYSGLYYRILAQIPDIPLIRRIAHAIQEINEHKIDITSKKINKIEDILISLTKIESAIITQVFAHRGFEKYITLAEDLLVLNRLTREKDQFLSGEHSILFHQLAKFSSTVPPVYPKKDFDTHDHLLTQKKNLIASKINELGIPFDSLKGSVFIPFFESAVQSKIYVEEGY